MDKFILTLRTNYRTKTCPSQFWCRWILYSSFSNTSGPGRDVRPRHAIWDEANDGEWASKTVHKKMRLGTLWGRNQTADGFLHFYYANALLAANRWETLLSLILKRLPDPVPDFAGTGLPQPQSFLSVRNTASYIFPRFSRTALCRYGMPRPQRTKWVDTPRTTTPRNPGITYTPRCIRHNACHSSRRRGNRSICRPNDNAVALWSPGIRTCRDHSPQTIPKHFPNLSEIATLIKTLCIK